MSRRYSPPPVRPADVLPFRRRNAPRRSRRHPLVAWLRPLALALLIVGLPLAAAWWLTTTPRLALEQLAIETGERVPDAWVERILAPARGGNLLRLELARLERRLLQHPWVREVDLRKEPPRRLRVQIVERREEALLRRGGELSYLDADGRAIAPFEPADGGVDLPIVSAGDDGPELATAVALASEIEQLGPRWADSLSEIEVLGDRDFRIHTSSLPFPLIVEAGTLRSRIRPLMTLLPGILERFEAPAAIDLRFARRIVIIQPSVRTGDRRTAGRAQRT